jgi:hypothetical protein
MMQVARRCGCAQVAILDRDRPPNPSPEGGFLGAADPCAGRPMGSSLFPARSRAADSFILPLRTASARSGRRVASWAV